MNKAIETTLEEREVQHGNFNSHCDIERALRVIFDANSSQLDNTMYIGAGMVIHKLARILNNGANHADSWHDIGGYAMLVERHVLRRNAEKAEIAQQLEELNNE